MGMSAEIIATGPFSKEIAKYLGYPVARFENTKTGATVTCRLFGISQGSSLSKHFAAMLGISDPWDFNQHHINAPAIDFTALEAFSADYPEYQDDVESLYALFKTGFAFHFRPEG